MARKSMLTGLQLGGLFTDTSLGWASKCPIVSDGETIYNVPFQIPKVINVIYQVLSKPGWCFQFVWKVGEFMSRLEEPGLPYWSPTVELPIYSGGKRQHFLWNSFPHWNSQFSQTPWCEGKRRPTSSSMRSSRQCWSLLVQLAPQIDVENCWIHLHPMPAISCTCISSKVLNVRIFLNVLFPAWNYGNYVQAIETQASSWSSVCLLQPLSWPGARCQHVFPCVSKFQWSKMLPTLQHEWFSVQSLVTESSWKNLHHGLIIARSLRQLLTSGCNNAPSLANWDAVQLLLPAFLLSRRMFQAVEPWATYSWSISLACTPYKMTDWYTETRGDGLTLCRGVVGCDVVMAHDPLVELTFMYSYMVDVHGTYLVGGLIFPIQLGMSSSQLTNSIIFQRGRLKPPTSYINPRKRHQQPQCLSLFASAILPGRRITPLGSRSSKCEGI